MDDLGGLERSSRREVITSLLLLLVVCLLFGLLFSAAGRVDEQVTKKCSFSEHLRETARLYTSNGWFAYPPLEGGVVKGVVERKSEATP